MALSKKTLYSDIIEPYAQFYTDLFIISGYASSSMAEKLLKEYPTLNVTLYIGMTSHEGISMQNHNGFKALVKEYGQRLKVMYQITQPPTHIKLYSWIKDGIYYKNFVGSANFSENGLFKLNELMVESHRNFKSLYNEQEINSIDCTHSDVCQMVKIYDDTNDNLIESDINSSIIAENNDSTYLRDLPNKPITSHQVKEQTVTNWFEKQRVYVSQSSLNYYDIIDIPILFKNQLNYSRRGINNVFRFGREGYLEQSNKFPFTKTFPYNTILTFFTDDNEVIEGIFKEQYDARLYFYNDIYQYIANRLNIDEKRPIEYSDLQSYNRESVKIYKIKDTEFLFDFSN